jgi:serine protease SohB
VEFLNEYLLFLAKATTIVAAILIISAGLFGLSQRGSARAGKDQVEVKHLNRRYEDMALTLKSAMLPRRALRQLRRGQRKRGKQHDAMDGKRLFVLDFHGDIRATAVSALREEVTAILTVAEHGDEVLLRLESAGGVVHGYGLAASQLLRLKAHGLGLTVAIDKVAASGGYLMACVADRILAAPFAIVGSIGVVAQLPNFHRLLKKNAIDFEQFTAGEFKRTVTLFGENTDKARAKFQQDLDDTHRLFKTFVTEHRPALDVDRVATGEYWYGTRALDLRLVDDLRTSDDYLLAASRERPLFEIRYRGHRPLLNRLLGATSHLTLRPAPLPSIRPGSGPSLNPFVNDGRE